MTAPGPIDPVLALIDCLHRYRRSWRCWLIGGPAAVDGLALCAIDRIDGIRFEADFQVEQMERRWRHATPGADRRIRWCDAPHPSPPPEGTFTDRQETFPLRSTRVVGLCERCYGSGWRPCARCHGTGTASPGAAPCPGCGGRGEVPCRCGDYVTRRDLVCYQEEVHAYRHEQQTHQATPARLKDPDPGVIDPSFVCFSMRRLTRFLTRAWNSGGEHLVLEAPNATHLWRQIRTLPGLEAEVRARARAACAALRHAARRLAAGAAPGVRARLLHQRARARVAHVAAAHLVNGSLQRQFVAAGTSCRYREYLLGPQGANGRWLAFALYAGATLACAASIVAGTSQFMPLLACLLALPLLWGRAVPARLPPAQALLQTPSLLLRSLRASSPPALIVAASPHPAAAARCYALFAHLAAHAQLPNPSEGGTVLDPVSPHLWELLHHPAAPAWSGTCQIALGAGVPGPRQVRLLHLVEPPEGEPDDLCRSVLRQAAHLWLVLPGDVPAPELDRWLCRVLAAAPDAMVTLVRASGAPHPEDLPDARARLAGRTHRTWNADVDALATRTLGGYVSPAEAAAIVRFLVTADPLPPGTQPGLATPHPEPPRVSPPAPPARTPR